MLLRLSRINAITNMPLAFEEQEIRDDEMFNGTFLDRSQLHCLLLKLRKGVLYSIDI